MPTSSCCDKQRRESDCGPVRTLRVVLALWLSLAVPTGALASATQPCSGMAPTSTASQDAHAGHDMKGASGAEHLQHMAAADSDPEESSKSGCQCGCNCSGYHCVSSASGLPTGTYAVAAFSANDGLRLHAGAARTAAAHHLDLLRPPSLT